MINTLIYSWRKNMDTMRPGIEDIKKTQMEPLEMTKSKIKNTPHGTNS